MTFILSTNLVTHASIRESQKFEAKETCCYVTALLLKIYLFIISDLQGQSLKHFKYLLTLIKLECVSERNHQMEKLKEKNQFYHINIIFQDAKII